MNPSGLNYDMLINTIIRPPRCEYRESDLGEKEFTLGQEKKKYHRKDFEIKNNLGLNIKASFVELDEKFRTTEKMPVVIYLHGNASSRLEGIVSAPLLLEKGINVFAFDFSGSGLSDGQYISLGYYEKDDLKVIIDFVEKLQGVGEIGLWGRSMGASTALLYAASDPRIKAMVYDSPFSDFPKLAREICKKMIDLPKILIDIALAIVSKSIKDRTQLDFFKLVPIDHADKITIPGLFIHANDDNLIHIEHSKDIYEKYAGEKELICSTGDHNSERPKLVKQKLQGFFEKYLLK